VYFRINVVFIAGVYVRLLIAVQCMCNDCIVNISIFVVFTYYAYSCVFYSRQITIVNIIYTPALILGSQFQPVFRVVQPTNPAQLDLFRRNVSASVNR
jgi:hypothetical protein